MEKLSKRQLKILEFVRIQEAAGNKNIKEFLVKEFGKISRATVARDLDNLLKNNLLIKRGGGRSILYEEKNQNELLRYVDVEDYFQKSVDERKVLESFNFDIFDKLSDIFSKKEIKELEKLNKNYQSNTKELSLTIIKKEFERLTIELSWKSSQIEGNTYSLIDTEILIKNNQEAKGHNKKEAIMILNHKKALDYIRSNKNDFKKLNLRKIENVHSLIVNNLGITKGPRKRMVGITGTKYKPIDNQYQIKEVLEKTIKVINDFKDPFSKALVALLMISYIQPFEDGNKRTARLLSNALLLSANACPLSYRSVDKSDYKKAILIFYEQNSGRFFKEIFAEQFRFAIKNYFRA